MKTMDTRQQLLKLLDIAPMDWRQLVETPLPDGHGNDCNGKTDKEWNEIADDLESAAIRALLLSEYIQARRGGYCGDHKDHANASRMVEKRHKSIRKALGFSLPGSGLLRL